MDRRLLLLLLQLLVGCATAALQRSGRVDSVLVVVDNRGDTEDVENTVLSTFLEPWTPLPARMPRNLHDSSMISMTGYGISHWHT